MQVTKFEKIIQRAGSSRSVSVLQFHRELSSGTAGYTSIRKFIEANNRSLPNAISHSKFLMLLSLLNNSDIAPLAVARLQKIHAVALSDGYYATL